MADGVLAGEVLQVAGGHLGPAGVVHADEEDRGSVHPFILTRSGEQRVPDGRVSATRRDRTGDDGGSWTLARWSRRASPAERGSTLLRLAA